MVVNDTYDQTAIDQLEGVDWHLRDLALDELQELGELGFSLRKTLTSIRKVATAPLQPLRNTRVGKAVVRIHADIVAHVRKVFTKKWFMKAAPYLSIAAQLLNFVVPGLGVLVSFAISASATALALVEAKKAKKAMAKAEAAATKEEVADQAAADVDANKALDEAYSKGGLYFTTTYGMDNVKWSALPVEGKNKFLNVVIYDQHAKAMQDMGVTRDAFQAMSVGEEQEALSKMAQNLPEAKAQNLPPIQATAQDVVQIPVDAQGKAVGPVPSIAAFTGGGEWYKNPYILGGGALILLLGTVAIVKLRKSS